MYVILVNYPRKLNYLVLILKRYRYLSDRLNIEREPILQVHQIYIYLGNIEVLNLKNKL